MQHQQHWANVDNTLDVMHRKREGLAYIEVSSALFPLLYAMGISKDSAVSLYLEDDGLKMVFGIIVDDTTLYDLWHYTIDKIPKELFDHCS